MSQYNPNLNRPPQQPIFASPPSQPIRPPQNSGQQDVLQFYAPSNTSNYSGNNGYVGANTAFTLPVAGAFTGGGTETRHFVGSPWGTAGYSDEPSLGEEIGLNFPHIYSKSLSVLNVFRTPDKHIMDDTDLIGPIFFCILFGAFLMLSGKVQFGYIYGVATLGACAIYVVLNLMSESGIDGWRTVSVLGYSLLPMVLLSFISMALKLQGLIGFTLSALSICWCTYSASTMFVTVLSMTDQRLLLAYPIGLLYASFALLTVF